MVGCSRRNPSRIHPTSPRAVVGDVGIHDEVASAGRCKKSDAETSEVPWPAVDALIAHGCFVGGRRVEVESGITQKSKGCYANSWCDFPVEDAVAEAVRGRSADLKLKQVDGKAANFQLSRRITATFSLFEVGGGQRERLHPVGIV